MKGPSVVIVAQKKPNAEILKKRKAENKKTTEKTKKTKKSGPKDTAAPKRPASAFLFFMEDFRKSFKENFPDNKSISAVGKAGGAKWKSMSDAEKAPYVSKAQKRKAEYGIAVEAYKKKLNDDEVNEKPVDSEKSSSEVHDDAEQEASS